MDSKGFLLDFINPFSAFQNIWKSRDLLKQLVKRNIQTRYKGSMLGFFWILATPLMMLVVYTFVFSVIFKARWPGNVNESKATFALILFCGLTVFNIFSESVNGSVGVIVGNPNFVKKVVFPLEILPVMTLLTSLFFGLIWMAILILGIAIFMQKFCLTAICLPIVLLPLVLFSCGVSWFLASIGTFFRDLGHVIGIALQLLVFGTPIFYSFEMIPPKFQFYLRLNPLTDIVQNARKVLIYNQWPDWTSVGIMIVISYFIFKLGYIWFMKTKRGFADVL
jgi:lipopolysaccharide transport system permease protein